jgi:hypothetical protein
LAAIALDVRSIKSFSSALFNKSAVVGDAAKIDVSINDDDEEEVAIVATANLQLSVAEALAVCVVGVILECVAAAADSVR